jgi:hypothetical protein
LGTIREEASPRETGRTVIAELAPVCLITKVGLLCSARPTSGNMTTGKLARTGHNQMLGREQPMSNVDALIDLIREARDDDALAMLDASPGLATDHSDQHGQLRGASPLHWAGHRNAVRLCERLIQLGADVNDSASDWWLTPLAWAADAGSADAVELLLRHGADVNQDAVVGTTALHAVAMGGSSGGSRDPDAYRRTAEILIAHGAEVNRRATGHRGQTPLDDAVANNNDHVAVVLRKHGARV